jgi:hypothetical protein
MAQAVSRRHLIPEARVRFGVSPCENSAGQSGTGIGFLRVLLVSPVDIIPLWLSIIIYPLRKEQWTVGSRSSETQSHPVNMKT